jgi:anti-anti-sigma factor
MTDCDVTTEVEGGVLVVRLVGEIDMSNIDTVRTTLAEAISNQGLRAVVDLSQTTYLDSAGINFFLELRERLRVRGQGLRLVVPERSAVRSALNYAGVIGPLSVSATVPEALATLDDPI